MKDSGVQWVKQIPENWNIKSFKHIFSFGHGLPITKENLVENGIPVISYGQIHSKQNDGVHLTNDLLRYVSEEFLESNPKSLLETGDIVFADTSEDYNGLGNAIYIEYNSNIFAGYHTIICHPTSEFANKYWGYLFTTDIWRLQIRSLASGIKVYSVTQQI